MRIQRIKADDLAPAFGILMAALDFNGELADQPLGVSVGVVPPGGETTAHRHDETELIVVIDGSGRIRTDDVEACVGPGHAILFDPFETHTLREEGNAGLRFLTVYWRDRARANQRASATRSSRSGMPVIVTSTPPTPNGDLHLGHAGGPYLGADVHCRYLRMCGVPAFHITGSDDYQSYTLAKAIQLGLTAQQTADHFADRIAQTLAAMEIHVDQFTRSSHTPGYRQRVTDFLAKLRHAGVVRLECRPALFDGATGAYLYEVDVSGGCPNCGSSTGGNICEECGHPNVCTDLAEPRSKLAAAPPFAKSIERLHFRLSDCLDAVRRHHDASRMATRLRVLLDGLVSRGLPDVAVTHPSDWGIPAEGDALERQVIWVWLEMVVGFLVGMTELSAREGLPWTPAEPPHNVSIVHFFGYDNAFYHTILFPAALQVVYPDYPLRITYVCNEFYLLEGAKFSTSRNHAIWAHEFLMKAGVDETRFFLAYTRPELERTNFSWRKFDATVERELVDAWHAWLVNLNDRVAAQFGGKAPDAGVWTLEQRDFMAMLQRFADSAANAYAAESFSLQRAARVLCELVRESRKFAAGERHWGEFGTRSSEYRTSIALELAAARQLALLAKPLMPGFSGRILAGLGESSPDRPLWPDHPAPPAPGTPICIDSAFARARPRCRVERDAETVAPVLGKDDAAAST
jgi:methionyl-tRNA synthetase